MYSKAVDFLCVNTILNIKKPFTILLSQKNKKVKIKTKKQKNKGKNNGEKL